MKPEAAEDGKPSLDNKVQGGRNAGRLRRGMTALMYSMAMVRCLEEIVGTRASLATNKGMKDVLKNKALNGDGLLFE
jgi:hypothetical protein